jgi:hypothetical protein
MGYFSFHRMITPIFVKCVHFLGFLVLTAGGIGLAVWAGLRLYEASIDRQLGWRYVIIGAAAATVGNVVWRVICELWIVLFNIHDHLADLADRGVERTVKLPVVFEAEERPHALASTEPPRKEKEKYRPRAASVLGLS